MYILSTFIDPFIITLPYPLIHSICVYCSSDSLIQLFEANVIFLNELFSSSSASTNGIFIRITVRHSWKHLGPVFSFFSFGKSSIIIHHSFYFYSLILLHICHSQHPSTPFLLVPHVPNTLNLHNSFQIFHFSLSITVLNDNENVSFPNTNDSSFGKSIHNPCSSFIHTFQTKRHPVEIQRIRAYLTDS